MNDTLATHVQALSLLGDNDAHGLNFAGLQDWVRQTNVAYQITSDNYTDVKRIPRTVTTLEKLREHIDELHAKIGSGEKEELQKAGTLRSYKVIVCCIHMLAIFMTGGAAWVTAHAGHSLKNIATLTMTHARTNVPADIGRDAAKLWNASCDATNLRIQNMLIAILQLCPAAAPVVGGGNNNP
jgi:hypothetical protein